MKRTSRILLTYSLVLAVLYLLFMHASVTGKRYAAAGLFLGGSAMCVWSRDFMVGRYFYRKGEWQRALDRFTAFEAKLVDRPWSAVRVLFMGGIYTFDGIALTRNNIAVSQLNLGNFERAEFWLARALERDEQYALAYVNLATLAALRREEALARKHADRAVALGYSGTGAQAVLRRSLARANAAVGRQLK